MPLSEEQKKSMIKNGWKEALPFDRIGGGKNATVILFETTNNEPKILKQPLCRGSHKSSFSRELSALQYLSPLEDQVPSLLDYDSSNSILILSRLHGVKGTELTNSKTKALFQFLPKIQQLPGRNRLENAKEACLFKRDVGLQLERRYNFLQNNALSAVPSLQSELLLFLENSIEEVVLNSKKWHPCETELIFPIVSPADFGLQNSVWIDDVPNIFDFEFFGIDSTVKLFCDFILHPANNVQIEQYQNMFDLFVLHGTLSQGQGRDDLAKQIVEMLPYFAAKWSLIMLNDFLPHHSTGESPVLNTEQLCAIQRLQLDKAMTMIKKCDGFYERCIR